MATLQKERISATNQSVARAKRATNKTVYPARPVQGKIDFTALRKDVMKRFPKTLAYLAK